MLVTLTTWADEASTDTVWLLSSHTNSDHDAVVEAYKHSLSAAPHITLRLIDTDAGSDVLKSQASLAPSDLIVAIGSSAARLAHTVPATQPVLDILIPRLLYESLSPVDGVRSALYIDQPFERQMNLCRLVVPNLQRLGVLYGPTSQHSDRELRKAAEQTGVTLLARRVTAGSNPNAALDQLLDDSQLLLALPDPEVFTRYSVAGLLLTAYHHDVPVIGFSAAYANAGALAAVFSTPEQIGRDAAEITLAAQTASGWALPAPRYPAYYSVAVNRQVGRSLSMNLPDITTIMQALARQEQAQQ